ncbi:assimilatory nitrate reductase (NADH) beta subunit [Cupriavidus sp. OV038]|jgi:nitrite reductase (NADH) large subunit|uniref:NAD(P)/FAD-dependent oxidoreductase n=1 Tax=unclassified Cupriavidus TaxID=2640874 RepID=UPI0008EE1A30|nr:MULTISPECIES: FAD-dependent oxidoreductase [unclassified Cupriavidus]SFD48658.1 assimilatory nitrate reductase (NADH) beta subunit [Cupriavidus sp. OV038]SFQ16189.1 assimilatory nitrate reductase (NADH) beta subunit [Cupriavidus sp. OV096]
MTPTATPHAKPRLVVVGNGMAGMRTVEELLKLAPDLYDITVFGAEPHGNYNRILLSPVLAGEKTVDDIMLNTREWYAAHGIELLAGDPVEAIDRPRRTVRSASGREVRYDRLLLATGSKPFILPVPGHTLDGVIAFRDIQDVETMLHAARNHRHAVVIGGGLLGLEAANGLLRQGMDVTVVHLADSLMERQLDKPAAALLKLALERRGLRFLLGAQTAGILGDTRVTGVLFKDGSQIPADLVVMTAGVRPNIELAAGAGLRCERAIVVDDTLQTFDPRIYAVGECVQHRQATFGLVAPIWDQARVCAAHLAGAGHRRYVQQATATKLKVTGVDLYSAGDFIGADGSEDLVLRDPRRGVYKRLVLQDGRLVGAVLYGDVQDGPWYFDLIQSGKPVGALRQRLLFGKTQCEALAA